MIDHAGLSDQGNVRFRNEDFIAHRFPEDDAIGRRKGSLFVVCDGVGGSGAGDVASRAAAETFVAAYYDSRHGPERALKEAFQRANVHVYDLQLTNAATSRMQTTLSAVAIVGAGAYIAHVGDSRIYRVRSAAPGAGDAEDQLLSIQQLSLDHSEVGELVRMQILTPEMARRHPRRNIITRSLGSQPVVRGFFAAETVLTGDIFLICTDGLWEPVEDAEIREIAGGSPPDDACRRLIALALERGTTDNVSVQIAKVAELPLYGGEPEAASPTGGSWLKRRLFGEMTQHG